MKPAQELPVRLLTDEEKSTFAITLNRLSKACREMNDRWWRNPHTGRRIRRNQGELLLLVVTEIAEAFEGIRKNLMDDKLPHRRASEVEIADAFVRLFDFCGEHGLDVGGALVEKCDFNAARKDHTFAARLGKHGKKF